MGSTAAFDCLIATETQVGPNFLSTISSTPSFGAFSLFFCLLLFLLLPHWMSLVEVLLPILCPLPIFCVKRSKRTSDWSATGDPPRQLNTAFCSVRRNQHEITTTTLSFICPDVRLVTACSPLKQAGKAGPHHINFPTWSCTLITLRYHVVLIDQHWCHVVLIDDVATPSFAM